MASLCVANGRQDGRIDMELVRGSRVLADETGELSVFAVSTSTTDLGVRRRPFLGHWWHVFPELLDLDGFIPTSYVEVPSRSL
jgi:hypothetical protein